MQERETVAEYAASTVAETVVLSFAREADFAPAAVSDVRAYVDAFKSAGTTVASTQLEPSLS